MCDNGKMLHDAPASIRKRIPEDLSITNSILLVFLGNNLGYTSLNNTV